MRSLRSTTNADKKKSHGLSKQRKNVSWNPQLVEYNDDLPNFSNNLEEETEIPRRTTRIRTPKQFNDGSHTVILPD